MTHVPSPPSTPRRALASGLALAGAAIALAAGAAAWTARLLPDEGELCAGVRVAGEAVAPGTDATTTARLRADVALDRSMRVVSAGRLVLSITPRELGATADVEGAARAAAAVGHEGGLLRRIDEAMEARAGRVDIPVRVALPVDELAARLARFKDEGDTRPLPAKLDPATRAVTPDVPGRHADVYAAASAMERAITGGDAEVEVPYLAIAASASAATVASIDTSQIVSTFETRYGYLGAQAGRAQNVERAAARMHGVVLMPGEVVSFNANVGPRSEENGFAAAPEIYKGEMREGIGGGTCQVASTLHAAAFFGGLRIAQRSSHSRPSGYIALGLDATVVYPVVDLKLENPYDFPIVIAVKAAAGAIVFELRGEGRSSKVELSTQTVGVARYKRKVEEVSWLGEGKLRLKQRGIRGISVKKTRTIERADGEKRVEVTTDVYPPTVEIYQVPPGTDVEEALPPLPGDDADRRSASNAASPAGDAVRHAN